VATIDVEDHAAPPSGRGGGEPGPSEMLALVAVVGLAKVESPAIEAAVVAAGIPHSFVGVVIALLILCQRPSPPCGPPCGIEFK
jgi:Ca2+:H+ antiporter